MSGDRAYGSIRSLVEGLGGSMVWAKKGYAHGAWIITLHDKRAVIRASGKQSFPELDGLLVPLTPDPRTWNDYTNDLLAALYGQYGVNTSNEDYTLIYQYSVADSSLTGTMLIDWYQAVDEHSGQYLSLIHISEPTRPY